MRIAFLLTQSLESPSGLGRFGPLAKELAACGHEVEVFALHHNFPSLHQHVYRRDGVSVAYVGQMHVRKIGSRKSYFRNRELLAVTLNGAARMALALARSRADVVQLCKPQPVNALAARLGARGRPIFCDCDDYEAASNRFSASWQRAVVRYFEDGVAGYAQGISVNTRFSFDRYVDLGFPPDRLKYVPNGVDRARFAHSPDLPSLRGRLGLSSSDPVVVYVGSMSLASHAVGLLLVAFVEVSRRLPDTRLLLVGGGEDFDLLLAEARRLGIDDKTIFVGRVDPRDAPAYYSLGTVSVDPVNDDLTARARSPLKVLESLACGVPVVTGDVGDRRMLLGDGEAGVLVQPDSASMLAEGVITLLANGEQRERAASAALALRERNYWDRLAADFVPQYAAVRPARTTR